MLKFFKAFKYAVTGLVVFFRHETNGKIQLLVAAVIVLISFLLKISSIEWIIVTGCIATVLSFEMINSAMEKLCNLVHPGIHPAVKIIKDMCAGAVLWVSVASVIIGCIIFLPKILALL